MEAPETVKKAKDIGWPVVHLRSGQYMPLSEKLVYSLMGKEPEDKLKKWKIELEYFLGNYQRTKKQKADREAALEARNKTGISREAQVMKDAEDTAIPEVKNLIKDVKKKKKKSLLKKILGKE